MKTRLAILTIAAVAPFLTAAPAWPQDLNGTTPCCGVVCNGTTSTRCGDLLSSAGLSTQSGCIGLDSQFPATCVGGHLLDAADSALLDGCVCILEGPGMGPCVGPLAAGGAPISPQACTEMAVAACQEAGNVVVTQNDAACGGGGGGGGCNPACTDGQVCENGSCVCPDSEQLCSGTCIDTSSDPNNCGSCGNVCASGTGCQSGQCVPCGNRSGGGDNTNPGGHGNPTGCNNPGGSK